MCMLCVIPPNTIPTRDKLENSALNNPHGFGFAIVIPEEGRIISERTMNADESINRFLELRAKYMSGHALWHARIATSGLITIDNCHPFVMPDEEYPNTTYVGHNGMLDVYEPVGDERSDTRIFVEDLLPAIGGVTALDNEQVFNMISEFTRGSKVCVLTVNPKAKYEMYLFHEKSGHYDEGGVWWSNNSCELSPYVIGSSNRTYLDNYAYYSGTEHAGASAFFNDRGYDPTYDLMDCNVCQKTFDWYAEAIDDTCPHCKACLMCDGLDCMCYRPSSKIKSRPLPQGGWNIS